MTVSPSAKPSRFSGTMTNPLALVMVEIEPEPRALTGSAENSSFFWVTLTRTKFFLPSAVAIFRVRVALTVHRVSSLGSPSILHINGLAKTSKPMMAATGLPERTMTGLPSSIARAVGMAGLMAMPWMMMPGSPILLTASGTRSNPPTLVPPVVMTASAILRAIWIFSAISSTLSFAMPRSRGSASSSQHMAVSMMRLVS